MSTTALKMLALVIMFIDHIGEFIPLTPIWFRWLGRISAPLFFFCMAWGFYYAKNKKIHLIRMYLCGVGMAITNIIVSNLAGIHSYTSLTNNIFVTLFITCFIIFIIETLAKNPTMGKRYLLIFVTSQIISTILVIIDNQIIFSHFNVSSDIINQFYGAILGNIFLNEGGVPFIALGILLYYSKNSKKKLIISYSCFCIVYTILYNTNIIARILMRLENILPTSIYTIIYAIPSILSIDTIPRYHIRFYTLISYRWMVIFALPFMLLYNGNRGKGFKYFFYIFYPVHIYILYFIGNNIPIN